MASVLGEDHSIFYQSRTRTYNASTGRSFINEGTGKKALEVADTIKFCPWCGKKLPKDLWNEWYDEIEELGFELPLEPEELKKIPKEYMTEEWWIKRGL